MSLGGLAAHTRRSASALTLALCLAGVASSSAITLDGTSAAHTYDGHGALSAGASSRLLWDYAMQTREGGVMQYLVGSFEGITIKSIAGYGAHAQSALVLRFWLER